MHTLALHFDETSIPEGLRLPVKSRLRTMIGGVVADAFYANVDTYEVTSGLDVMNEQQEKEYYQLVFQVKRELTQDVDLNTDINISLIEL